MESMIYEILMTSVYECDKFGKRGTVGADYYREMEHAVNLYRVQKKALDNREISVSIKSLEDIDYEARVAVRRISNCVDEALRQVIRKTYDDEKVEKLNTLSAQLIEFTDQAKLDEVIKQA